VPRQGRPQPRRGLWLTALIVVAVGLLPAAPAAAGAVPAKFWGAVPQGLPTLAHFQRLKAGGVDELRFPIDWASVESIEGAPNWSYPDAFITRASESGIEVLPFLTGAPGWAVKSVTVNAAARASAPLNVPVKTGAQRSAWQRFLRGAVGRYGPLGAFWSENPGIPYKPIETWQIWNEPNFKYFVARPNPAEYGKLVKISYTAIKGVDSNAQLLLAGLFAEPREAEDKRLHPRPAYFATEFLRQMYRSTPGIKQEFIGISLHPYTTTYQRLTPEIENVRKVMREAGDGGKGIWITELGWSSGPPKANNAFAKGPQGQAAQLRGAFKLVERNRTAWKIKRVFWFSVEDAAGFCNFCDGSGLFSSAFAPKPVWRAYVKFAGGTP
jgi:hypothetical protein